jgi:hypothetical protein
MPLDPAPEPIVIADYGASEGHNSLIPMRWMAGARGGQSSSTIFSRRGLRRASLQRLGLTPFPLQSFSWVKQREKARLERIEPGEVMLRDALLHWHSRGGLGAILPRNGLQQWISALGSIA